MGKNKKIKRKLLANYKRKTSSSAKRKIRTNYEKS
jgi:hypothetical protein